MLQFKQITKEEEKCTQRNISAVKILNSLQTDMSNNVWALHVFQHYFPNCFQVLSLHEKNQNIFWQMWIMKYKWEGSKQIVFWSKKNTTLTWRLAWLQHLHVFVNWFASLQCNEMQCNAMQCNAMQCNYIIALVDCEKGAGRIKSWCKVGKVIRHPLKRDSITQIKEIHSHASQRYQFAQFQKNERRHKSKVQKWRVSTIKKLNLVAEFCAHLQFWSLTAAQLQI